MGNFPSATAQMPPRQTLSALLQLRAAAVQRLLPEFPNFFSSH
jgi:hypothetical protein